MAAAANLMLFLLLSAAISAAAQIKIPVSSWLQPGTNSSSVWLSPSGKFAFGFLETANGYAVCIYLASFIERTVVWTANKIDPILPNNVFALEVNVDGVKLWQERDYNTYLYDNIASPEGTVTSASMLDNGNFVLYNHDDRVIWQSFDYPTASLVPGQSLGSGRELVSRASQTDLAIGLFRMKMQRDGNLVQYPVSTPDTSENAFFSSSTYGLGKSVSLNLGNDGRLYFQDGSSDYSQDLTSGGNPVKGTIYMARLDPDGVFRLYNRSLDFHDRWRPIWWSTDNKCDPKGIRGVNSFCVYEVQIYTVGVTCPCLPGFTDFGDACREDFNAVDCRDKNKSVKYEIARMANVTWEDNYYAVDDTATEEDCGRACLDDCDCIVALFKDGRCRRQRSPLRYGKRSTGDSSITLVRLTLPSPAPPPPPEDNSGKTIAPVGSGSGKNISRSKKRFFYPNKFVVIMGVSIGVALLLISSIIIYYFTTQHRLYGQDEESKQHVNKLVLNHGSLAPKRYSYKEIKKITKSFTEKLGQGGYGIVYKGKLGDGQLVAVKVLTEHHNNAQDFVNEVASISRTSHVNIVNLLGFCFERKKRALVYEFMPNKSLDKFIYRSGSMDAECSLEWKKLYEISVGVARGLEYLHGGCNTRIIHFDIKPQNILLDQELCPKISDFGLAKLCMMRQSVISMLGTRGTIGYIAPEVFSRNFGVVSHKSDVYSYGIMLLRMAEARKNVEVKSFQSSESFYLEKMYEHVVVQNEKAYDIMSEEEEEVVRKMLMVGFWCIQTAPSDRPSMNNVVDMLGGNLQSIQIPPLPFLLSSPKPQLSCLLPVIAKTPSSTGS